MGEKRLTAYSLYPVTPPSTELSFNLHHLVPGEPAETEAHLHHSADMEHENIHSNRYCSYPDPHESVGLGVQYNTYDHSSSKYYSNESILSQMGSPYMHPTASLSSSPTPLSTNDDVGLRTRSRTGRGFRTDSPHGSSRKSTPPRVTKKRARKDKSKTPKLTAPLSVLTKDMINVPVRDMQAWVNRSKAERNQETERRNGYVTRPMNSFMLYRSAYSERTKVWCVGNNHQVVSSVSGESWPLEPPEVREFYNELATIERINHQNAHPGYKFSPAKPGAGPKKRREIDTDDESEPSDISDPDADLGITQRRAKQVKRSSRDARYPARANLGDAHNTQTFLNTPGYDSYAQQNNWQLRQPTHSLPPQTMGHHQDLYVRHYNQAGLQTHSQMIPHHSTENIQYPITYGQNQSLIGLPGGTHQELLGLVDSNLFAYEDADHLGLDEGLMGRQMQYDPSSNVEAGLTQYSVGANEGQPHQSAFERQSELEKFWAEQSSLSTQQLGLAEAEKRFSVMSQAQVGKVEGGGAKNPWF